MTVFYRRTLAIFAAAALMLAAASCHKKAPAGTEPVPPVDSVPEIITPPQASLLPQFPASFGNWTSLEVPVSVNLSAPKSLGASGRATFVNGREILISLRLLGFEIAQLYADEDSVFVLDKVHKYYAAESVARLGAQTGLTLADIQGYLLGRPLRPVPELQGIGVVYDWNASSQSLAAVGFTRNGVPAAAIAYAPYVDTPTGPTAPEISLAAKLGKTEINLGLTYRLSSAKWNSVSAPLGFRRPGDNYRRLDVNQLSKNL